MVKASDCGSDMRGFDPHRPPIKKQMTYVICFLICVEIENPHKTQVLYVGAKPTTNPKSLIL